MSFLKEYFISSVDHGSNLYFYLATQENQAHVSVLCEYDALPEIGHACGHNLIAECGVAACIGIKAAMDNAERNIGKVNTIRNHSCCLFHFLYHYF